MSYKDAVDAISRNEKNPIARAILNRRNEARSLLDKNELHGEELISALKSAFSAPTPSPARVRREAEPSIDVMVEGYEDESGRCRYTVRNTYYQTISVPIHVFAEGRDAVEDYARDAAQENGYDGQDDYDYDQHEGMDYPDSNFDFPNLRDAMDEYESEYGDQEE